MRCELCRRRGARSDPSGDVYRSSVKEWQVSWFVLVTIILNIADTVVCKYCRTVRTKRFHISIKSLYCNVCAIQSYGPQNKPADLTLFYWRPVHTYDPAFTHITRGRRLAPGGHTWPCRCNRPNSLHQTLKKHSDVVLLPIFSGRN